MVRASISFAVLACACSGAPPPSARAAIPQHVAAAPTAPEGVPEPQVDHAVVIGRLRPKFRDCYQAGLLLRGDQQGSVRLAMAIDSAGRTSTVTPTGGEGLDRCVVDCLVKVASNASFSASRGGTNVLVPLSFGVVH